MKHLIERYIYDVTRRLPEPEREDVSKELSSNIYDMLAGSTDEDEIKAVLYELGSPALLAEQYRQKPRYLISPAIYDDYVRALKLVLPLVGGIVLVIGMILGAVEVAKDGGDAAELVSNMLSTGIATGVSAVVQALVWTTVGFVIAERVGAVSGKEQAWRIEDLPDTLPNDKSVIPLSDSITELVLTAAFSILGILMCLGKIPVVFVFQDRDMQIFSFFSDGFLASCVPAIAVMALLGVGECIIKIKERRWTPVVCGAVVISNLISVAIALYLISRPDALNAEFILFMQSIDWLHFGFPHFTETRVVILICVFAVMVALADCAVAANRTFGNRISMMFRNQK